MNPTSSRCSVPPVVIFAYSRPDHLERTLEALARNALAGEADVIIYSDAARGAEDRAGVEAVRALIARISGFHSVRAVLREKNLGLAQNIVDGVGEAVATHGRVIVLEDDIVTSPHFLTFMRDALEVYAEDRRVMHVSACRYPVRVPEAEGETFFLRVPLCWGWATWDRAWNGFSRDPAIFASFDDEDRKRFDFLGTHGFWKQARGNLDGKMRTWFVFWYARLFKTSGLALFPRRALARNIGHDGSGVHCGASDKYDVELSDHAVEVERREIVESAAIERAHRRYFKYLKAPSWRRSLMRAVKLAPLG